MSRVISGLRVSWRRYLLHKISLVVGSTTVIFTVVDPTAMPMTTFSGVFIAVGPLWRTRLTRQSDRTTITRLTRQSRSKCRQRKISWRVTRCALRGRLHTGSISVVAGRWRREADSMSCAVEDHRGGPHHDIA